jgi:Phage tail baseplate hub (GPD)
MGAGYAIQIRGAPDPDLGTVASLEVHESIGEPTRFRLSYGLDIAAGDLPLLKDDRLAPGTLIAILAPDGSGTACLVKGPVHAQHIHLEHGGEGSTLDVMGADTSITMDRENKAALWSDLTDSDAVTQILGGYSLAPDVDTTPAQHPESKHVLVQRETDLAFIRRLARRNGFLFWITCDSDGATETAHFKRPPVETSAAQELVINLDEPEANLATLDISWDVERPTSATAAQLDLNDKSTIDGSVTASPLAPLGALGFSDIASDSRALHLFAPVDDAGDLNARGEGALIESSFFIRARGKTTADNLGGVLRAHTVVNLRGAGSRHSGKWLCASVRHLINDVEHRMEFELIRNGWET